MKVNETKYAKFDYTDGVDSELNKFKRGDVVIKTSYFAGEPYVEIGVVLQVHDADELRTDMFGNESADNLKRATKADIKKFRPSLLESN